MKKPILLISLLVAALAASAQGNNTNRFELGFMYRIKCY